MKNLIFIPIIMLALMGLGCRDTSDLGKDFMPGYADVRKIVVTGLPSTTERGEVLTVEVGYYPLGVKPLTTKQLFQYFTESGEVVFPDGIDVYSTGNNPSYNPPQHFLPTTFVENVLTITVEQWW